LEIIEVEGDNKWRGVEKFRKNLLGLLIKTGLAAFKKVHPLPLLFIGNKKPRTMPGLVD